jgi:hypothetical protein
MRKRVVSFFCGAAIIGNATVLFFQFCERVSLQRTFMSTIVAAEILK